MSAINEWPEPSAWLYGFIDTSVPGYRKINNDGSDVQLSDGYYSFPAYIDELNTQMGTVSGSATTDSIGRVTINGAAPMTWTDRLGWMLGLDVDAGDDSGANSSRTSDRPPPAAIPLISVNWERIDRATESAVQVDRQQRGLGYLFGDSELMRLTLLMHAQGLRSFKDGWTMSGQVIISTKSPAGFSADAPWSTSNTDGYLQGYVVGVSGGRWIDSTRTIWQANLILSKA